MLALLVPGVGMGGSPAATTTTFNEGYSIRLGRSLHGGVRGHMRLLYLLPLLAIMKENLHG